MRDTIFRDFTGKLWIGGMIVLLAAILSDWLGMTSTMAAFIGVHVGFIMCLPKMVEALNQLSKGE